MDLYNMSGDATVRHLEDIAKLSGNPRTMYLEVIERAHGREYRMALAREDMRRREAEEAKGRAIAP